MAAALLRAVQAISLFEDVEQFRPEGVTVRSRLAALLIGLMTLGFVVGASSSAEAALVAWVCNDAACANGDDVSSAGSIAVFDLFGWDIVASIPGNPGSADSPELNLTFSVINAGGTADPIWLYATDTDFTGTVDLLLNVIGATTGPSVSASALGGDSNDSLDLLPVLIALGPFGAGIIAGSGTGGPVGLAVNPYSLTIGAAVAGTTELALVSGVLSLTSSPIPEPASVLLLGLALTAGGWMARRRRRA